MTKTLIDTSDAKREIGVYQLCPSPFQDAPKKNTITV